MRSRPEAISSPFPSLRDDGFFGALVLGHLPGARYPHPLGTFFEERGLHGTLLFKESTEDGSLLEATRREVEVLAAAKCFSPRDRFKKTLVLAQVVGGEESLTFDTGLLSALGDLGLGLACAAVTSSARGSRPRPPRCSGLRSPKTEG